MIFPDSPMLEVRELSFRYPALDGTPGRPVHECLSFQVEREGVTGLLGAADAGKTTLSRIIAGLIPRFTGGTLEGKILLDGADARESKPFELMERVGLVGQDSDQQIFTTRCDTEIAFALESMGIARREMVDRVEESLARVGLSAFKARNPSSLSGGEKKRLLFACLYAIGPSLWILDESLEELDRHWKAVVLDMLAKAKRTVLVMDSRLSGLLSQRARGFFLLSGGSVTASSDRGDSPAFAETLRQEGILPGSRSPVPAPRSASPFLTLEGLRFSFPGPGGFSLAIDQLELARGEICALVGDNGSGKSTLGRILCGLLQPQAGEVRIGDGQGFSAASRLELNRRVGYLFQNPDHQIYLPSVREELSMGLHRQGLGKPEIEKRVREASELFSLPHPSSPPALLSYGARRMLQAATYYLLARELLILDEVDSGLSYRDVEKLLGALFSSAPGILLITHDVTLAVAVSDRVLVMRKGTVRGDLRRDDFSRLESLLDGGLDS
jgi:energy-coupling factor transport system ATP-binding protein